MTTETCWSCPTCAFTFAAYHAYADGSLTCPVCEVETKDRRIADLQHEAGLLELAVENRDADVREFESRLATAHDMLRHYEQERDSWGAAYKQRAAMTDKRIAELEAGLAVIRAHLLSLKAQNDGASPAACGFIMSKVDDLLPSEET